MGKGINGAEELLTAISLLSRSRKVKKPMPLQARKSSQRHLPSLRRVTRTLRLVPAQILRDPKTILCCDSTHRVDRWRVALGLNEHNSADFAETRNLSDLDGAVLALIDVMQEKIEETLKALRANSTLKQLMVLVADERITDLRGLAGVLPKYRALACGKREIIQLAQRRIAEAPPQPPRNTIL